MALSPELIYECKIECDWWDAQEWCKENIGEFNVDWYKLGIDPAAGLFGDTTTTWLFKDQKKMALFLLRWS